MDTGFRILNYITHDTSAEERTLVQDKGYRIQDTGYRIQDTG